MTGRKHGQSLLIQVTFTRNLCFCDYCCKYVFHFDSLLDEDLALRKA